MRSRYRIRSFARRPTARAGGPSAAVRTRCSVFGGKRLLQERQLGIGRDQLRDHPQPARRTSGRWADEVQVAYPLGELSPVHIGHDHIGEHQPDLARVLLDIS